MLSITLAASKAQYAVPILDDLNNNQHHAQDNFGQYNYGYQTPELAKQEIKTADGVTQGEYSYMDANGKLQIVRYIADDINGFRVAATNLPAAPGPVEDAAAPQVEVKSEPAPQPVPVTPVVQVAPVVQAAPVVQTPHVYAPYAPIFGAHFLPNDLQNNQHHAQDEFGQYNYGYQTPEAAKQEIKTADGVTQGEYSYIDANGILQIVKYIADDINGFRVSATNLPKAPGPTQPAAPVQQQSYVSPQYVPYAPSYPYLSPVVSHQAPIPVEEPETYALDLRKGGVDDLVNAELQRTEDRDAYGIVLGSYQYLDTEGTPQTVRYKADDLGFQVLESTIPVVEPIAPQPVGFTPEVLAAREEHLR